ncbi:hypothetical protein Baya_4419 [Bagarius yarrelli]|uniref:Uncharacterized protein n=1 Tax=Bagarius yarrelli TaxID=175774 RepID=A0A556TQ47_BAGYA|nr:hypothetical protein Baya_4419 [Bagarius yarrelli]
MQIQWTKLSPKNDCVDSKSKRGPNYFSAVCPKKPLQHPVNGGHMVDRQTAMAEISLKGTRGHDGQYRTKTLDHSQDGE